MMQSLSRPRRTSIAVTAALCTVATLAACGSDADTENGGRDGVKVMVYGPIDAKGYSLPEIETAARAGVKKVNAEGGIAGQDLELIVCNDNNDPNAAAGCARQAVEEGVVAIVGGYTTFDVQVLPVLAEAGIPVIGSTPIADFTSPVLYPFTGGAASSLFGLGASMAADPVCEGKVAGVLEDFAATAGAIQLFQLAVGASGAEYTGTSKAPQGATDFAPAVASAASTANCIGMVAGPQTAPIIVTAANAQDGVELIGTADAILPDPALSSLGAAADGTRVVSNFFPLSADAGTAEMDEFLERTTDIDPDFTANQISASAYLAPIVLAEALKNASGEITSASVIEALNTLSGFDTGLGPVVDFAETNPTQAFSRLPVATPMYVWIAADGRYVADGDTRVDIAPVYEAAAAAGQ